jgi:hypothetical protein
VGADIAAGSQEEKGKIADFVENPRNINIIININEKSNGQVIEYGHDKGLT